MRANIELIIDGVHIGYNSESRLVTFFTESNVSMNCLIPDDWALTRIFQFMESAVKANKNFI